MEVPSSTTVQYNLSTSDSPPDTVDDQWSTVVPESFTFDNSIQGEKTVFARIMKDGCLSTSTASSTIFIDTKTPTSTIDNLKDNYNSYDFIVSWKASDSDSGASGVEKYDVNYKIGSSSDWMRLAKATTSTSTEFRYSTTTDNTIFFRARAKDKAGNESKWSKIASTTVIDTKADHIVISEIYIDSTNDWIELYNPTDESIDLAAGKYRIERSTASRENPYYYLQFGNDGHGSFPGGTDISSQGYYLIVDEDATSSLKTKADVVLNKGRGFALTDSNTVYLATDTVSSSTDQDIIVDFVGYGQSSFYEGEGAAPNPVATSSIERKALATSTASKLATGSHKQLGNSYDTNDNNQDFVLQEKPNPQSTGNNNQEQETGDDDFPINLAWPERNHDSQNTNRSQYVGQISGDATSSIFSSFNNKIGRILVGDAYMYTMMINSNKKNKLYSIELDSGEKQEIYAYGQAGLAAIDKNNIYLKTRKKIISIDKESSEPNWKFNAWTRLRDIHLGSQGDIFTATKGTCNTGDKYKIYKIESKDGTTTWKKIGEGTVREYYGTVLDEQDNFYLSISQRGRGEEEKFLSEDFLALDDEGKILWSYNRDKYNNLTMGINELVAGNDEVTDMVIDADNNVYLMGNGKLVALNMNNGVIKWSIEVPNSAKHLVMGPAGKLYFGVDKEGIYVVD